MTQTTYPLDSQSKDVNLKLCFVGSYAYSFLVDGLRIDKNKVVRTIQYYNFLHINIFDHIIQHNHHLQFCLFAADDSERGRKLRDRMGSRRRIQRSRRLSAPPQSATDSMNARQHLVTAVIRNFILLRERKFTS